MFLAVFSRNSFDHLCGSGTKHINYNNSQQIDLNNVYLMACR